MINPKRLLLLVSLGLLQITTVPASAQLISAANPNLISHVSFKPPPDDRKPDQTLGAGSRQDNPCFQDTTPITPLSERSMMALVPSSNYGLTLTERPTFFIALPKTSAQQLILSISENGKTYHSQTVIAIKDTPGIIKITPAQDAPPLEVGKEYQWSVVLVCGSKPGPNDPAIASWVRRVAPPQTMPSQLKQEHSLAQAVWYGNQGLWYDALNALVEARRSQPQNEAMTSIWSEFLTSVGLQDVSSEPIRF